MTDDSTLAPLRDELDTRRAELEAQAAALQKTTKAVETVKDLLSRAVCCGMAVRVDHADRASIRVTFDLAAGGDVPSREAEHPVAPPPTAAVDPAPAPAKEQPARWTEAEDATAVSMYRRGATVAEIAAALGRPVPGTTFRLRKLRDRLNLSKRAPRPKNDLKVSPSPKSTRPSPPDNAEPPAAADVGSEGQGGAAAADQSGAAPRPERSLQAKPVSAGTVTSNSGLTLAQRATAARVSALPFSDWTVDDDLDLVEAIVRGTKVDAVAADLERDRSDCLARWRLLCPTPGPEAQADLLAVLRRRVAEARGAA